MVITISLKLIKGDINIQYSVTDDQKFYLEKNSLAQIFEKIWFCYNLNNTLRWLYILGFLSCFIDHLDK